MSDNLTNDPTYKKMIAGESYFDSPVVIEQREFIRKNLIEANQISDMHDRSQKIASLLGSVGDNFQVENNFRVGIGQTVSIGNDFYANYGVTFCDEALIAIGDNCMMGPNCGLYTPYHPLNGELRATKIERSKPITLGDNVWLGGGVTIIPGVTIGNNVVVGAGSVVTKSVPDNMVVAGNPARVIRNIDEMGNEEF